MYTRRDGSARYAPLCTRACRSSILRSKSASYASHVSPSTPAAAFILSSRNASSSSSTLMWCRSAVNFSCFLVLAIRRMRSSACDTLSRPWVRHVLCCSAFSLVSALGSTDSAAAASAADCSTASLSALFTGFSATMTESDFLRSCVIGYGSSPSRCGPPALSGRRSNAGSPRFRRDPFARDVLFDPGRVDSTSHNGTAHVAFGSKGQPPPQRKGYFGAQSHTPRNRCVRFVFGIAAASRNTRFQAACWALPGPDLHRLIAPASLAPSLCPPYANHLQTVRAFYWMALAARRSCGPSLRFDRAAC